MWFCAVQQKDGSLVAATQTTVNTFSDVLFIHLKRYGRSQLQGTFKYDQPISFEESFDFSESNGAPRILVAIIVHSGPYGSGHYVAYGRGLPYAADASWYKFDDAKLTTVTLKEVLSQKAYVLVYRRPWC